jgi:HSP20 family molecular chaperone IbpA
MKRASKSAVKMDILENADPISAETEAIQERIRQRAFELSHTRPPDAHALYDWIMAESEIISVPPMELVEKNEKLELKFAVAGVNPDDVNVMITPERILLKSEYSHRHDEYTGTIHVCDFKSATIFRSVDLPHPIDVKSAKVDFADGMIVVTASKVGAEQAAPKRTPSARKVPPKKSQARTP